MNINVGDQVLSLVKKGFSIDEIASMLDLSLDDVKLIIDTNNKLDKVRNIEDIVDDYKPRALKVLFDIMNDVSEKGNVRVAAAKTIFEYGQNTKSSDADLLKKRIEEMRERVNEVMRNTKIINITPQTTTSDGLLALKE